MRRVNPTLGLSAAYAFNIQRLPKQEPAPAPAVAEPTPNQRGRSLRTKLSLATLLALACVGVWYLRQPSTIQTSIDIYPIYKLRLAVLPFENLSPDPKDSFFADGLHEELLTTIAQKVPGIEVISRTTMMTYRAAPAKSLATIAHELAASHLIEGSVRREGDKARLTLQLIDARTDKEIWSTSYDRTLADTLTLESQVAQEVAAQLALRLEPPATLPPAKSHQ